MLQHINFTVGEAFPLPIAQKGDGALFQVDVNGAMFILQLSTADVIAVEAFRTGAMEFALFEKDGLLFLTYRIDGIFKDGWGDAPLSFHALAPEHLPGATSLDEGRLHLYLVDPRLHILLALRAERMPEDFLAVLRAHTKKSLAAPLTAHAYMARLARIYDAYPSARMREEAAAVMRVEMNI